MKVFKLTEYQSPTGYYHCSCVDNLAHNSAAWYMPARVLGLSLTDYILLLKNSYNCILKYDKKANYLHYYWSDYNKMHQFVLYCNRIARQKNYMI